MEHRDKGRDSSSQGKPVAGRPRRKRSHASLLASHEASIWVTGGALILCVVMIVALLGGVLFKGLSTFWPQAVERLETVDGRVYLGAVTRTNMYLPDEAAFGELDELRAAVGKDALPRGVELERSLVRTGNFKLTQNHFQWVEHALIAKREKLPWATVVERMEWGRFYGYPEAFVEVEPIEARDSEGRKKTGEQLEREADERIASFSARTEGEPAILVERYEGGEVRLLPIARAELEQPSEIRGAAWVYRGAEAAMEQFEVHHGDVIESRNARRDLEKFDTGKVNRAQEQARLAMRRAELELEDVVSDAGEESPRAAEARAVVARATAAYEEQCEWSEGEFDRIRANIDEINLANSRYQLLFETAGEGDSPPVSLLMGLDEIVRALPTNRMSWLEKLGVYFSRWLEFLWDDPREANSEGGVFPAIFGTVLMTMIMAILVVPFGVLSALYLAEYAKNGPIVSAVRIAVNNLAGVPSIVFGIFGLGFFCYTVGANIDELFFRAELPNPTFGKGGLIWASLTLALLTLPVVIVATEEALAAVPNSAREGSYACGAGKWQTIRRIILPRAMPGIMTGMILAMARGAGEVAPLMLVGAVKLAPELPLNGEFPFIHAENSFMHLGFHIFDVGFQSQNSEAAKPMVYTTTLVLVSLIFALNLAAIGLRKRLARQFESSTL